jgi:outer membrane protein assembly factor BamB
MDGQILALDARTGNQVGMKYPEKKDSSVFGGIYGTPSIGHNQVYVTGFNGTVHSLAQESLRLNGIFHVEGTSSSRGVTGSVVVDGNKAIFGSAIGPKTGRLYVLDASNIQKEICRFPKIEQVSESINRIWATPIVSNGIAYFGDLGHRFYAVSIDDCTTKWSNPIILGGGIGSTPLILDDTIYVGAFDRKFYAIDVNTGAFRVLFEGEGWFWSGIASNGKHLFVPNMDGKLYSLDPETGNIIWKFDTKGRILSSPVVINDQVVVASDAKQLYVLDAASGRVNWSLLLDGEVYGPLMAKSFPSGDDVVYLTTTDNTVQAINVSTMRIFWFESAKTNE